MSGKREYGDYQTPIDFAERVCRYLKEFRHIKPSAVVEPTCGVGNFLRSSLLFQAGEYYGIEINPDYCEVCKNSLENEKVKIINSDFFAFSSKDLIKDQRQVLILGNPPWVTNSTLSVLGSDSHTRYGAYGCMAIGEGGPELARQLLSKTYDIAYPRVIAIHLTGAPRPGVGPQDTD